MKTTPSCKSSGIHYLIFLCVFFHFVEIDAQESASDPPSVNAKADEKQGDEKGDDKLYFSFAGSKWSDVIEWLANTADLALHVDELPKGTFTYTDSNGFTLQEAINRINLFLLPEGFTLVRSGRLLSVINLEDPKSMKQLETLARTVTPDQLEDLPDHDMVKCLFSLGDLTTEEAVEELSTLNLLKSPDIFSKTKQILVTDTAGKIKLAHKILSAFEPDTLDNGTIIKSFQLQHVAAEDVLTVARPHLGLATGEMIGIDVSISADLLGKNIFVTGVEDKVKLIEGLIREIDVAEKKKSDQPELLQSHRVTGGNVELVYNVLQTLLSGEEIRLSMDEKSQSIVALAPAEIQKEIAETVTQLQGAEAQFAVIPLQNTDPYFVVTLLEQMLDLDDSSLDSGSGFGGSDFRGRWGGWGWGGMFGQSQQTASLDPPKIDADPAGMRLFVLGTESQIEQIRKIVKELDVPDSNTVVVSNSKLRIIPLKGKKAVDAIETAARFWQGKNSIIFYPTNATNKEPVKEKVIADQESSPEKSEPNQPDQLGQGRILSKRLNTEEPPLQIQLNNRGIMLQCDDVEALNQFVEILGTVIGPTDTTVGTPIIYYLKYAKPDEAIRMLAELLDGGDTANDTESGTLVNGLVLGSSDTFFGSLVTSRDGTLTLTYGTATIIADIRLNRLIAQGSVDELELVENYLKIIDKDRSITSIEVYGTSHVIELEHVDANEVATTLRQVFFGRVMGGTTTPNQQAQKQPARSNNNNPPQPNRDPRQNSEREKEGNDRGQNRDNNRNQPPPQNRGGAAANNEPKMTIAVHEPSNSLIVTAPEPLFKEVEKVAKLLDTRSVQTVEVLKISRPLANDIRQILNGEIPMPNTQTNDPRRSDRDSGRSNRTRDPRADRNRPR